MLLKTKQKTLVLKNKGLNLCLNLCLKKNPTKMVDSVSSTVIEGFGLNPSEIPSRGLEWAVVSTLAQFPQDIDASISPNSF